MRYLVDTGILLRLVNRHVDRHQLVRDAVNRLLNDGHDLCTTLQNVSEFWNVCTRPAAARSGLGLNVEQTFKRLRIIERVLPILPDSPETYPRWRELVLTFGVQGVQVHDTKLVALMAVHGVTQLLTLNEADFRRYPSIVVASPTAIVNTA